MKLNKQICIILILALLVALAASVSAKTGDGTLDKSVIVFPSIMKNPQTPWNPHPYCACD